MSLRLRLRLALSTLLGALLLVTVAAALQFRDIATATAAIVDQGQAATEAAATIHAEATTAAIGLGILAALVVVFGTWASRVAHRSLFDRLAGIDRAVEAIQRGDDQRRLGMLGDDELAHVAAALDRVLDQRALTEAALQGRSRELRALLVALLHRWPRPAALVGIDGELLVSTLEREQEDAMRAITPKLRVAARTLLSREFVTASELSTDVRLDASYTVCIRALAIGPRRIVGWLADIDARQPAWGSSASANR